MDRVIFVKTVVVYLVEWFLKQWLRNVFASTIHDLECFNNETSLFSKIYYFTKVALSSIYEQCKWRVRLTYICSFCFIETSFGFDLELPSDLPYCDARYIHGYHYKFVRCRAFMKQRCNWLKQPRSCMLETRTHSTTQYYTFQFKLFL